MLNPGDCSLEVSLLRSSRFAGLECVYQDYTLSNHIGFDCHGPMSRDWDVHCLFSIALQTPSVIPGQAVFQCQFSCRCRDFNICSIGCNGVLLGSSNRNWISWTKRFWCLYATIKVIIYRQWTLTYCTATINKQTTWLSITHSANEGKYTQIYHPPPTTTQQYHHSSLLKTSHQLPPPPFQDQTLPSHTHQEVTL